MRIIYTFSYDGDLKPYCELTVDDQLRRQVHNRVVELNGPGVVIQRWNHDTELIRLREKPDGGYVLEHHFKPSIQ